MTDRITHRTIYYPSGRLDVERSAPNEIKIYMECNITTSLTPEQAKFLRDDLTRAMEPPAPKKPHYCPAIWNGVQCNGTPGHSGKHCAEIPGFKVEWEPVAKRKRVVFEETGEFRAARKGEFFQASTGSVFAVDYEGGANPHNILTRREEDVETGGLR